MKTYIVLSRSVAVFKELKEPTFIGPFSCAENWGHLQIFLYMVHTLEASLPPWPVRPLHPCFSIKQHVLNIFFCHIFLGTEPRLSSDFATLVKMQRVSFLVQPFLLKALKNQVSFYQKKNFFLIVL